ncbi:MAG: amino acid ABC transporter ATP-binding protein [Candidatus Binatia bacterium]
MTTLEVRALHSERGDTAVLRGIDLTVARGEVVAILGASGSGKTTLLRSINYLTPFTEGEVRVAGERLVPGMSERRDAARLQAVRRGAGMVFQSFQLFPHLRVVDNVTEAPRRVLGMGADEARALAVRLLARVGLDGRADEYPQRLSGGQQQRVAIARALAMAPEVMLLDEPTSALDPSLVGEVLSVVADLAAGGQTMLVVTHEMGFARRVASRVVVLAEGRIAEEGSPDEVLDAPRSPATRMLLGRWSDV